MQEKIVIPWYFKVLARIIIRLIKTGVQFRSLGKNIQRFLVRIFTDLFYVAKELACVKNDVHLYLWIYCLCYIGIKYQKELKSAGARGLAGYNCVSALFFTYKGMYPAVCAELYKGTVYVLIAKNILPARIIKCMIIVGLGADLTVTHSIGQMIVGSVQSALGISFHWIFAHLFVYVFAGTYTGMTFGLFAWNLIQSDQKKRSVKKQ